MVIHAVHINSSKHFTPTLNSCVYIFIYTGSPTSQGEMNTVGGNLFLTYQF